MADAFDARWRSAALRGEPAAIGRLTAHALPALYRYAYHRVGRDDHRCEEVVQETLCHALTHLEQYDPARSEGQILPWLVGHARNAIQKLCTRQKALQSLSVLWAQADAELQVAYASLESEHLPESCLERAETRDLVNATMAQLPDHYRAVLEGKYVRGQSVQALAHGQATTEKAIESQLARARQAFRVTFQTLVRNFELELT